MAENKSITLTQFLAENPVNDITAEVYVSKRFKDAGLAFKIRAMSGQEFSAYQKQATAVGRHKKVNFDSSLFNELVVLNHTVEPNFKDANVLAQCGCTTPEQFLYSRLKAGEIIDLATKISELSGFDADQQSLVDEVKNS